MARIDQLRERLKTLRATLKTITDATAQRGIKAAIARTERQIGREVSKMGRKPKTGGTRGGGGRFGSSRGGF